MAACCRRQTEPVRELLGEDHAFQKADIVMETYPDLYGDVQVRIVGVRHTFAKRALDWKERIKKKLIPIPTQI